MWKFNPPGAPRFGGIGERLVRSCNKEMTAVLDVRSPSDDFLITTMCLVEQTLKSRPLTSVKHPKPTLWFVYLADSFHITLKCH